MSACPHYKETPMLDIFGELNRASRAAWGEHLSGCPDCRAEKEEIARTLEITKTAFDAPLLGEAEAGAMRERVIGNLISRTKKPWERKQAFFFSRAFVPTLASACVLLIALGFIASRFLTGPEINESTHLAVLQEQPPADDLAIINNLDLLNDLDSLNKLARALDQSQLPPIQDNVQGKNSHGRKPIFS